MLFTTINAPEGRKERNNVTGAERKHAATCTCRSCYRAAYYAAHREEEKARAAAYRATHREEKRAYTRAYYAAHREELREKNELYDATCAGILSRFRRKLREHTNQLKRRLAA